MAAIPRELIESELFGHEKGSFTGATMRVTGRFEQAEGGTLFLDEIGDMPLEAQTRLLRVLQDGRFTTVGGRTPIKANVRIIAATHRDLQTLIKAGVFREDLYYRLNVVPIRIPPLRQRAEDIPELISHFLSSAAADGLPAKTIDASALEKLKAHRWPGNVRELENLVKRLVALYSEPTVTASIIDMELAGQAPAPQDEAKPANLSAAITSYINSYFESHNSEPPAGVYDRMLAELERPLIALTMQATRGNQVKAAEMLGLNRNTLRKKIRDLSINVVKG
jgi:two-component system, NtrC family, nitrogen regulation response regulator GlnG